MSFQIRLFLYLLSWKEEIDKKNHLQSVNAPDPGTASFTGRSAGIWSMALPSTIAPLNYSLGDALAKQFLLLKSRLTPLSSERTHPNFWKNWNTTWYKPNIPNVYHHFDHQGAKSRITLHSHLAPKYEKERLQAFLGALCSVFLLDGQNTQHKNKWQ